MIRARAGIGYTLAEAMDDGHCGLPLAELRATRPRKLLDIPETLVREALDLELADGHGRRGQRWTAAPCVFLAGLHAAERVIARAHPQPRRGQRAVEARSTRTAPSRGSRRGCR